MPAAASATTLRQILQLLTLLPDPERPAATTKVLLDLGKQNHDWSFNVRTLQRYLNVLEELGLAQRFDEPGKGAGRGDLWHVVPENRVALRMPLHEALALRLLQMLGNGALPREVQESMKARMAAAAKRLLDVKQVATEARWVDKIAMEAAGFALQSPKVQEGVLETIQHGLFHECRLNLLYRKASTSKTHWIEVEPRGLLIKDNLTYFLATSLETTLRQHKWYRLDRVLEAKVTAQRIRPRNFNFPRFIAAGGGEFGPDADLKPERFRAWVDPGLSSTLQETPLAPDQVLEPCEDGHIVSCTIVLGWHFRNFVVSRTAQMVVLEPQSLRDEVEQRYRDALATYEARLPPCTTRP